jgi:pimeloyl-ACP methyl ester carboxylesterase
VNRQRVALRGSTGVESSPFHIGGTGTPIVLLHGLFMSWTAWKSVIPILERTHTVFAPTLAGHRGGPAVPPDQAGVGPFVDAVERQMDVLGWQRAHVVGNSLGGWVALELAARGRAESVVLFSPAGAHTSRTAFYRVVALMRLGRAFSLVPGSEWLSRIRLVRIMLAWLMVAKPSAMSADEMSEFIRNARACGALDDLVEGMDAHVAPVIPASVGPVRVAWGRRDRTLPWKSYGAPFCDAVEGAERLMLEGVGHVPMYDDPVLVATTILDVTTA